MEIFAHTQVGKPTKKKNIKIIYFYKNALTKSRVCIVKVSAENPSINKKVGEKNKDVETEPNRTENQNRIVIFVGTKPEPEPLFF